MLTPEMVKEALQSSHDACDGEGGCIHADAISAVGEDFLAVETAVGIGALSSPAPLGFVLNVGIHIGYRLRQLEEKGPSKLETIH